MEQVGLNFPEPVYLPARSYLLRGRTEEVVLLYAHEVHLDEGMRLLVRHWEAVPEEAFLVKREDAFSVDSSFIVSRAKRARGRGESILIAHSHPGSLGAPRFSSADLRGEEALFPLLHARLPGRAHGAVVVSPDGVSAHVSLPGGETTNVDEIRIIGRRTQVVGAAGRRRRAERDEAHQRQTLIWGEHGQGLLRGSYMAIVGVGGTGSVVAQQLIHLGVGRLLVIDKDVVEKSNLPRIPGARSTDVGKTSKVDVVARVARELDLGVKVTAVHADVCVATARDLLRNVDLIFLCTDQHYSRAVVNALAVQYVIPLVDMGFRIDVEPKRARVISATGEVRVVVPGGYCLSCAGVLDAERIQAEKASPEERRRFPEYFKGVEVREPSVITLNSVIASLAVSVGMDMLVPVMRATGPLDSYRYNAVKGLVTHVAKEPQPACGVCGSEGIHAYGDDLRLSAWQC